MRLTSCALVAIGCLWVGAARAQDYNPAAGASTAPANGSLIAPASPNGVEWLNSMLGLSPSFLSADGKVAATYLTAGAYTLPAATSSSLGGVKVGTGLSVAKDGTVSVNVDLSGYLPVTGGTVTGDLNLAAGLVLKDGSGNYVRAAFGYNTIMFTGADSSTLFQWPGSLSIAGGMTLTAATGTGNAFACVDANGNLYRSATACN